MDNLTSKVEPKIVMLGTHGAGKTSIVVQLVKKTFEPDVKPTIGSSFVKTRLSCHRGSITVHVWDTAGDEKFRSLVQYYTRGAHAAILTIDSSMDNSIDELEFWYEFSRRNCPENCILVVALNKSDLPPRISIEDATIWASLRNLRLFTVAALYRDSLMPLFEYIGDQLLNSLPNLEVTPLSIATLEKATGSSHSCC